MATINVTETQTEEVFAMPRDAALHYMNGWIAAMRLDLRRGWTPEAIAVMQEAQEAAQNYVKMVEDQKNVD